MSNATGSVAALWRFPVKSMLGEGVERAQVTDHGLLGDRAFALFDRETGKRVSAVNVRQYPNLFQFSARFSRPPRLGEPLPSVVIELPDGRSVDSDDPRVHQAVSEQLDQDVELVRADAGGAAHHDAYPVSVMTNSTLRRMNELQPESNFDARRFRMNLIVECAEAGFPENDWVGKAVAVGDRARLEVVLPDARCIMTTLAQEDLPRDRTILAGLVKHNRLQIGDKGRYPCAGVYARVLSSGAIGRGDAVAVTSN